MDKSQKTRVAFVAENLIRDYDGAVRTMYQIIDRIDPCEFEFLFICSDGPVEDLGHTCTIMPSITLPVNGDYKMATPFLVKHRLRSQLGAFKPDVIHIATPSPLGFEALSYARSESIPVVSIYHTHYLSYVDYYLGRWPKFISPARNWMINMTRSFYNRCDIIYTPTGEIENQLTQIGVFSNLMTRWGRGLDINLFSPSKYDRDYILNITGNDKPSILYASRLVWEKNLCLLIDAYDLLDQKGFPYNFIIAGSGYAEDELKAAMPKAIFLGHQSHSELSRIYASSDVFVFPSISETYGNVVAEAMASGLPCVIANGGGSKEFIDDGFNGFLCTHDDPHCFIERIDSILSDDELSNRLTDNALKSINGLNWDSLIQSYFSDLQRLRLKDHTQRA